MANPDRNVEKSLEKNKKKLPVKELPPVEPPKLLGPLTGMTRSERLVRLFSSLVLAIVGFNFANSGFFREFPLFGMTYLAHVLITVTAALIGYYFVYSLLLSIKDWFERLIVNTVVEIVSNFWELQSKKIQEARREKQRQKSDEERKAEEEIKRYAVVLDTSVLIDGRIVEIVKNNFLVDIPLIIAQEVIAELHTLADSKDKLKRQKGRRGLDIVKELKKVTKVVTKNLVSNGNGDKALEVDKVLVDYCAKEKLKLMTLDYNLAKVAGVEGIKVLNINELANSIKVVLLPGEEFTIKIVHPGKEVNQGIGYLDDGTMIVVDKAQDKVGQTVHVKVVKVIQSPAGKIFFCK